MRFREKTHTNLVEDFVDLHTNNILLNKGTIAI